MTPSAISTTDTPTLAAASRQTPKGHDGSHRERDEAYRYVLVQLSKTQRVILASPAQYVLQSRRDDRRHGAYWRSCGFCRTRDALIKLCVASQSLVEGDPRLEALRALPSFASAAVYNRTVRHEWLDQYIIESIEEAQDQATQWLWTYNNDRPNMGIGGITPAMKLKMAA